MSGAGGQEQEEKLQNVLLKMGCLGFRFMVLVFTVEVKRKTMSVTEALEKATGSLWIKSADSAQTQISGSRVASSRVSDVETPSDSKLHQCICVPVHLQDLFLTLRVGLSHKFPVLKAEWHSEAFGHEGATTTPVEFNRRNL